MARRPTFRHRQDTRGRWYVDVPASMTATGKREQHFHPTRDAARDHAASLKTKHAAHGSNAAAVSPTLASDATKAAEILTSRDITLTAVARLHVEVTDKLAPYKVALSEVVRLYVAERVRHAASEKVTNASLAYLKTCATLRDRTYKSYEGTMKRLTTAVGDRTLSTLTASELMEAAGIGGSGAGAALHWRNLKAFWYWCAKSPRGWCDKKLFEEIEEPDAGGDGVISVMSPAEALALLRTAQAHYPDTLALFALSLFAGIRSAELERLSAADVTSDGVEVSSGASKKGRRRHITLSPTLAAWLEAHPFKEVPKNWEKISAAVRRLAGWKVESELLKNPPEPTRGPWPQNVMRHSHASYAVASGVELQTLLFEFGHTESPAVLREHYVGRATKKAALEYFSLRPKGTAKKAPLEVVEKAEGAA